MALTVAAMCGSLRSASYNQSLLDAFVSRSAGVFEVTQVPIREFPHFDQDLESGPFEPPYPAGQCPGKENRTGSTQQDTNRRQACTLPQNL